MKSSIFLLALSAILPLISAQGGSPNSPSSSSSSSTALPSPGLTATNSTSLGPCAQNCLSSIPKTSKCKGTETGSALAECQCASYRPDGDPMVGCIYGCPQDQQMEFALTLPSLCAQTLFLGLNLSGRPKPSRENPAQTAVRDVPTSGPIPTVATSTPGVVAAAGATATAIPGSGNGAGVLDAKLGARGLLVAFALGTAVLF